MAGAILTTGRSNYNTPEDIVNEVRAFYGGTIDLDPCSNETSIVGATENIILPVNGLEVPWDGKKVFVNPEFDVATTLAFWEKGRSSTPNTEVIYLVPAKSDTKLWQEHIFNEASAICFLGKRITFLGMKHTIPQPCVLIYIGERVDEFVKHFSRLGACVDTIITQADVQVH